MIEILLASYNSEKYIGCLLYTSVLQILAQGDCQIDQQVLRKKRKKQPFVEHELREICGGNMKKIVLVGLYFEQNLGDPMLFDCAKYLLMQHGDYDCLLYTSPGTSPSLQKERRFGIPTYRARPLTGLLQPQAGGAFFLPPHSVLKRLSE